MNFFSFFCFSIFIALYLGLVGGREKHTEKNHQSLPQPTIDTLHVCNTNIHELNLTEIPWLKAMGAFPNWHKKELKDS